MFVDNLTKEGSKNVKRLPILLLILLSIISKQVFAYDDLKCKITYEYFEKAGENRKTITLYKDAGKYKLELIEGSKKTTSYMYTDQNMVYTVINISGTRSGSKHELETMFVGMSWGIYFLNFPKSSDFTSITQRNGTMNVAGKDCTIYDINLGTGYTRYVMWNDIMMKKYIDDGTGNPSPVTIQATNVDESPVFAPGEFDYPTDVQYF